VCEYIVSILLSDIGKWFPKCHW